MTRLHGWLPAILLFAIALLGTGLHGWRLPGVGAWGDVLPNLFYIPIVIVAIDRGTWAALSVAFASGLGHAAAIPFGCGDLWIRPFVETLLYGCVAITAARCVSGNRVLAIGAATVRERRAVSKVHESLAIAQPLLFEIGNQASGLSQLVAGLIRRFRTPVSAIEGAVWLLENRRFPEEKRKEFVRIIQKETHQLDRALADILEFTQTRKPRPQKVDLSQLLDEVIQRAGPKEHGPFFLFRKDLAPDLPSLSCDQQQMGNLLLNLLMNSIQATPGGGQIVIAAREETDGLAITIVDHGRGIPPAIMDRVFEPFFTTRENGLGLGLTVARQIACAHGGKIGMLNTSSQGTSVLVWLPLSPVTAHEYRPHSGG